MAGVSVLPGLWHTVNVTVSASAGCAGAEKAGPGGGGMLRIWVDGSPVAPLEHGALQRDGSRLNLAALTERAGYLGCASSGDLMGKARFANFSVAGAPATSPPAWGDELPKRMWANFGGQSENHSDWWNRTTGNVDSTTDVTVVGRLLRTSTVGELAAIGSRWPCKSIYGSCNASDPVYHEHIPLPHPEGYARIYRSSDQGVRHHSMDLVSKMMNSALKMMNFALKTTGQLAP